MAQFQFRLQAMMQLAESRRDERRRELSEAQKAAEILATRHAELAVEIADNRRLRTVSQVGENLQVEKLLDASRYELLLNTQLRGIENQQTQVAEEMERRRQLLMEADREVRTFEKLKARKRAEFNVEQERKQQRILDEVATQRYMSQAHRSGGR